MKPGSLAVFITGLWLGLFGTAVFSFLRLTDAIIYYLGRH